MGSSGAAGKTPSPCGWVVEFRGVGEAICKTADDQHPAIEERCFSVVDTANIHAAGQCPISRGRVVKFRGCQCSTSMGMVRPTSRDYYLAVKQQRRRVEHPSIGEAACERPSSRGVIVKFCACDLGVLKGLRTICCTGCDQYPAIGEQRRRVIIPGNIEVAGKFPLKGGGSARL